MRHRGVTPAGGIAAADLRPVAEATGPFVTLLLDTDPKVANAEFHWKQRWKTTRRRLASAGATEGALARLDEHVSGAHLEGQGFYAIADAERCWIVEHWPERPRYEIERWAPLPSLTPLLAQRQVDVPRVVALVDREGADVAIVTPNVTRDETITGRTGPVIRRSGPGGWSQKRYQHRAEDAWAHTARQIAEALVRDVDASDAELVVIAGDVRAVQLVTERVPARVHDLMHVIAGGRAAGTDEAARTDDVARLVRTAAAEASVALLRKLREEVGQADRAVVGPEATFDAINQAQVEVLLVHDDLGDDRSAWFGAAPLPIGLEPDALVVDRGDLQQGRLADVAVRGALAAGAEIRVVPDVSVVTGGIGGILRWTA